ncbi:MAG: dihydrolipoyl dehydrogenase [Planctomycetaceae bacterium]|nr:dihydrolipoyl dehydrogenase [Planctomycetaceae bacterium]MCB9953871.1 dihydrolipoyl dehydrogenase [Planctomycetaceae bacterium]
MADFDLIVIGAGPGGYVAAIRAAQLGQRVACVEKESMLGGTCLRVGCIPSKALLESSHLLEEALQGFGGRGIELSGVSLNLGQVMQHKNRVVQTLGGGIDALFKKNKINRLFGHAKLLGGGKVAVAGKEGPQEFSAKHILVATGSQPSTLPGIELDGNRIGTSTEALAFDEVPQHLVVIGAGYIGLEMGTVWRRFGAKVTVLEYLDRILPGMDGETAAEALKLFKKQGLEFRLGAKVTAARAQRGGCVVEIEGAEPLKCDRVLVSVGRRPNTAELGLDKAGVEVDARGFIKVTSDFTTSADGVYAIGDVIGGPMLAHKAEEEGIACVERLYSGYGHVNYAVIPGVVYTEPEIATVGYSEEQLKEQGTEYKKGVFPFMANGRSRASGHGEGMVKVLAHAQTDRILGVHIIGTNAGELIAEAAVAMEFGASSEDLARCCHAHPTLAEALKEAALAVEKRAIHF